MLNLKIKGYISPTELQDILRQVSLINNEVPFSINNHYFDRNL